MESLLYSLALVLSAAAAHQLGASSSAPQAGEVEDRMVCRSIRKTGTRFDTRLCKRASEWRAIAEASAAATREIQSRPKINCTQPSGNAPC